MPVRLDPGLEDRGLWHDFHARFVVALANHLAEALAPRYLAVVDERVYLAVEHEVPRLVRPDVAVVGQPEARPFHEGGQGGRSATATRPILVPVALRDEIRERSVMIRTPAGQLVASLELLSPNNKRPGHEGRRLYLQKREQLLSAGVHLVEMDFLLAGERMPLATQWPRCDRAVLVVRAHRLHAGELYPFGVDDPLPTIALPLLDPDPDYPLALQPILEQVWRAARYDLVLRAQDRGQPGLESPRG